MFPQPFNIKTMTTNKLINIENLIVSFNFNKSETAEKLSLPNFENLIKNYNFNLAVK